jgi:hypothetical protein
MPTQLDGRHETPLFVAVYKGFYKAVRHLCESSEAAVEALGISNKNGDAYLHVAIQRELDLDFLEYLIGKISKIKLSKKGDGGNTVLHLAVEWERCKPLQINLVCRLVESSKGLLEVKNNEDLSPIQHHLMTRRRSDPNKREPGSSSISSRSKRPGLRDDVQKPSATKYSYDSKSRGSIEQMKTNSDSSRRKRTVPKGSIADAKRSCAGRTRI